MRTNQTQVIRDEERAKVEAEAVHGAQGWKIHDETSGLIQPWAPCLRLLVQIPFSLVYVMHMPLSYWYRARPVGMLYIFVFHHPLSYRY
jgi:hypothetical protein